MSQKIVIIADPGIDTAFALALAMQDSELDVVGLIPTAGNISPEQATRNTTVIVEQIDPPKWPRIAQALPIPCEHDGELLHGPGGLGGVDFPYVATRHQNPADELLVELIRAEPNEVSLLILGPCTPVATAFERDPELSGLVDRIVISGGTWREPGNAGPATEFHFACDPLAARQVIRAEKPHVTVVPLDVTRKLIFSPTDLTVFPKPETRTARFLARIAAFGIGSCSNLYGVEGFYMEDVVALAALRLPRAFGFHEVWLDVETRGELTSGMSVIDNRPGFAPPPNVFLTTEIEPNLIRTWVEGILQHAV